MFLELEGQRKLFGDESEAIPADQMAMIARIQDGETFVIDIHADSFRRLLPLLRWAKIHERFVYIGRSRNPRHRRRVVETLFPEAQCGSIWKNQRIKDGQAREAAIFWYREYLMSNQDLLKRLPELRGKILGCWCHPEPCHGDVLAELVNQLPKSKIS